MNDIFPICTKHLELCHPFKDEIYTFFLKFEPNLGDFNVEMMDINEEITIVHAQMKYIGLYKQHDDLVNIS